MCIILIHISYQRFYTGEDEPHLKAEGDVNMKLNTNQIVSISEANQNFSRVARLTDKHGEIYIFKNNKPKYKLVDIEKDTDIEMSEDEKIDFVASRILRIYRSAFEELAK